MKDLLGFEPMILCDLWLPYTRQQVAYWCQRATHSANGPWRRSESYHFTQNWCVRHTKNDGLEVVPVTPIEIQQLDRYHHKLLKQIQGLPDHTSSAAVYLLLGTLPLQAHLDKAVLTLYGSVSRPDEKTPLRSLMLRQVGIKDGNSKGLWTSTPSTCLTKADWRCHIDSIVSNHWHIRLPDEASVRPSISSLFPSLVGPLSPHIIWSCWGKSQLHAKGESVRVRLATDTYPVIANWAKYNQHSPDTSCPLCGTVLEDRSHFISVCSALSEIRNRVLTLINDTVSDNGYTFSSRELCQLLLSGNVRIHNLTSPNQVEKTILPTEAIHSINRHTNLYCLHLHNKRFSLLQEVPQSLGEST